MDIEFFKKFQYSTGIQNQKFQLPIQLIETLIIINSYFKKSSNNKLCIVLPAKENFAYWLTIIAVLDSIYSDYQKNYPKILDAYKSFNKGEKLILNNRAIVEWVGIKRNNINGEIFEGPTFKTRNSKTYSSAEVTLKFSEVTKLQKAPLTKKNLSSWKTIKNAYEERKLSELEKLLKIDTYGNEDFINNRICIICKITKFEDCISGLFLNGKPITKYVKLAKINEEGILDQNSPCIVTNKIFNLIAYLGNYNQTSKLVIDGFASITSRTDLSDINVNYNIPTILLTDFSEIEYFEEIKNLGFHFYNCTTAKTKNTSRTATSPFYSFERKYEHFNSFAIKKEICKSSDLEIVAQKLHSLTSDEYNDSFIKIKISLLQVFNTISRICYSLDEELLNSINAKLKKVEDLFRRDYIWLGSNSNPIEQILRILFCVVSNLNAQPLDKIVKFREINLDNYGYIICPSENEVLLLRRHINYLGEIISIADLNDRLPFNNNSKAILIGWPKSKNINKILSCFTFSEILFLFYEFENKYYHSIQTINTRFLENIKFTVKLNEYFNDNKKDTEISFGNVFEDPRTNGIDYDILNYELRIDKMLYSKFSAKNNDLAETIPASRVNFVNNTFIYAAETHRFIVVSDVLDPDTSTSNIYNKKVDMLNTGDLIALIDTDRDILVDIVKKLTDPSIYLEVKTWTDLWKRELYNKFKELRFNFHNLLFHLKKFGCIRHPATIRAWIYDENRIGPESDNDLRVIAKMCNSDRLLNNIENVRKAIREMTSLRMQAADLVREKIKDKLIGYKGKSFVNTSIEIQELGRVKILKIAEISKRGQLIDKKYIHKLISEEGIFEQDFTPIFKPEL